MADTVLERRRDSGEAGSPVVATSSPSPAKTPSRSLGTPGPGPSGDTSNATASRTERRTQSFADLEAIVEALHLRAQTLIDKINQKRSNDQTLMEEFKNSLTLKVEVLCKSLEEKMHEQFEQNTMHLQAKVQELTDVMQRISHLQEELRHVCKTLTTVYEDLGLQPEMS
ncbi:synaptonemal complex central element protein 2 [Rana temporaria]|uniref:synaptonemal complex central element protein 2 n=1 Tax=Rana temporaria TaxID=8407 RepID=UPI001AAD83C6|nr:synaptonemal complex central element protein 2 [Rana temporaria]XP_040197991.1 synaptonemal complex central element protein 2 [Rana temporaria]XP_040197992.1 synaptonemal complex central element protein 2 [Rana temporaria]